MRQAPPETTSDGEREDCPGLSRALERDDAGSLRGEIFSAERLVEHAKELALAQGETSLETRAGRLSRRISAARTKVLEAYALLAKNQPEMRNPSPAEEWLLDNSHIVSEQLRDIDEDLPWGYLVKLPRLLTGRMKGYPRVYGLCLDYLRHTDARIDSETLAAYVLSYQSVTPLAIGELWAVPILLRLGLILTTGTLAFAEVIERERGQAESEPSRDSHPDELARDEELAPREDVWREHARHAADQVLIGNAITSMRTIAALDWSKFFERTSHVDSILREDPTSVYAAMDEASRDRYRHAVEVLAEQSGADESRVATLAIALSKEALASEPDCPWAAHVGHYLVDSGRARLEAQISFRSTTKQRVLGVIRRHPGRFYFPALAVVFAAFVVAWGLDLAHHTRALEVVLPLLLLSSLPLSEMAIASMNALVVALLPPRVLQKLSFRDGIPAEHRTLVVVPSLIDGPATLAEVLARLEVRALANADDNVFFALLTDHRDAEKADSPNDAELAEAARAGIEALNRRHSREDVPRFHLFHRKRVWNAAESVFMGWERKRGKLEELNRWLGGSDDTTFSIVTAPETLRRTIRYVITLDVDTELPMNAARALIGTIAHPGNRPRWNAKGELIGGYGIVQPRVGTLPKSSRRSPFAQIMAGPSGIDPYTTAVSDVYQDLFGSGSYVGKAIYDVEAFRRTLTGAVPENTLLSHDLFEGIFARTALASDVELLDEQPSSYAAVAARQHRWIRGDFQLLPWLFPRVPRASGGTRKSPLPALGWWKLFDNLRRALVAPALVSVAFIGWFSGIELSPLMTLTLLVGLTAPLYGRVTAAFFRPLRHGALRVQPLVSELGIASGRVFLSAMFLLDQAALAIDAALRTTYRLLISRRRLLEWQTAGQAEVTLAGRLPPRLWVTSVLAAFSLVALSAVARSSLPLAAPFLLLWASAPAWALFLSRVREETVVPDLAADDVLRLRAVARTTWRFFEKFVTAEEHFLPPDNFQEEPLGVVAHRTSPTNIGCYLLSVLAARDFGFVTLGEVVERLGATLGTVEQLERREGHVLNWYDTTTLRPLEPRYVSTVDSGNLAAFLWTLREACAEFVATPIVPVDAFWAARDAFRLFCAARGAPPVASHEAHVDGRLSELCNDPPKGLASVVRELERVVRLLEGSGSARNPADADSAYWLERGRLGVESLVAEIRLLAPWVARLDGAPDELASGPLSSAWADARRGLDELASLSDLANFVGVDSSEIVRQLEGDQTLSEDGAARIVAFLRMLSADIEHSRAAARRMEGSLRSIGERAGKLADEMNFAFLYDDERLLFAIGYNAQAEKLDGAHYDLLASEARLASFVAIAKGDVHGEHWFRLGRSLAAPRGHRALWSWSGSMFEYLMPLLVMRDGDRTLLHETYRSVVYVQRRHGKSNGIPWGISESLFNTMDLSMTYQYRAFGVPGLGLRKGLEEDLVVAPYATALAALSRPDLAMTNFRALDRAGLDGRYGYYEAADYTPSRRLAGKRGCIVRAFMAHHQGMTLVALSNVLGRGRMQARFHADPRVRATELLLEERVPVADPTTELRPSVTPLAVSDSEPDAAERVPFDRTVWPRVHLLGHGDASSFVTNLGTGATTYRGSDLSRFREDATQNPGGIFVYVRDRKTGKTWSAGWEPVRSKPDSYEAAFSPDRVEIRRRDGDVETALEVVVSPESPAEVRRITLTNHGAIRRDLEVTAYTEVVLSSRAADRAHRAFGNLFVEVEALAPRGALIARRRPRGGDETEMWMAQVLTPEDGSWGELEFECSRARFIGRGRGLGAPAALDRGARLSQSAGTAADPVFAMRRSVSLGFGSSARVALATVAGADRRSVERLVEHHADAHSVGRTFELAHADARLSMRHLGVTQEDGALFRRVLSALVFAHPRLRSGGAAHVDNVRGRNALWAQGISGDLPLLVVLIDDPDFGELAETLLSCHELFRQRGFTFDLVFLDEEPAGYLHPFEDRLRDLVRSGVARGSLDRSVFVRRADQMSEADRGLVLRAAHVVLAASKGALESQIRRGERPMSLPAARPVAFGARVTASPRVARPSLDFDNGFGGFDPRTGEYVLLVSSDVRPPAPWCNVIANPRFGCLVSEGGATHTWSTNSQAHRLSPWSNDAVGDPSGEIVYVRDDDDGAIWSATPEPAGGSAEYVVRHGFGYTTFEHERGGLAHELTIFVDPDRCAKVHRLVITNRGATARRLRVYGAVEWVLGSARDRSSLTVATEWDRALSAIFAENAFSSHPERCAFFSCTVPPTSFTADRGEFFGPNGSHGRPLSLGRTSLSGRSGAGLDAGAAFETRFQIARGERIEVAFVLGDGASRAEARELALEFLAPGFVLASLGRAKAFFRDYLGKVTVRTPDRAFDHLLNGWLLYQVTSARLFARTAFYQSSGAYGFRDQLQDVLAVLHVAPHLARQHILRAATRQFLEGDVQHWWHPDTGEGIRTRCADDMLWLPYVAAEYVRATGDHAVFDEVLSFLDDKPVPEGDVEVLGRPSISTESASLYDHCVRAIDVAITAGPHGLPKMRGGDWNGGMNRVGGQAGLGGESVWLGFFLATVLRDFGAVAGLRGDRATARRFFDERVRLSQAIEQTAWDGKWYRRGYFESGAPLGASDNQDCRIDAIAQSWATISGVASTERASSALDQSEALLVHEREGTMSLLWPPFRVGEPDPGYIRAYPPGVRENGGQYTHGVLWTVLARTLLGQGDRAYALFSMLNPIHHSGTRASAARYAVEPYVVAGDVSAASDLPGRGGWTWYTGAAGWMYRIGLESILGVKLDGGELVIAPCVPPAFDRYEVDYRHGSSSYRIVVENPDGVSTGVEELRVDGTSLDVRRGARVRLEDDGNVHEVRVTLGKATAARSEDVAGREREGEGPVSRAEATGTSP